MTRREGFVIPNGVRDLGQSLPNEEAVFISGLENRVQCRAKQIRIHPYARPVRMLQSRAFHYG
jgi:hypothetical protein